MEPPLSSDSLCPLDEEYRSALTSVGSVPERNVSSTGLGQSGEANKFVEGSMYTLTTPSGKGNERGGVPSNADSVNCAKIGAARWASLEVMALPRSYPTHTAVVSSGVYPMNQASESVVPVFPATGRLNMFDTR